MGNFSAFWSSSRWPWATSMSSRRQKLLARVNWYLQSSLKPIIELITGNKYYYRGGRYRQVSLYIFGQTANQPMLAPATACESQPIDTEMNRNQPWVGGSWIFFNMLRPRQNGRHFPDHIFKCIFLNENVWIPIKISLTFVPKGPINNIPALVQIMAWRRPGDKPLSEPMMVSLPTHICVTRPQWVKKK